jgi:hypothetical protein
MALDGSALPLPPSLPSMIAFDSIECLSDAINEMAELIERAVIVEPEFSAELSVQSGDAGAGASAPGPADPLRAAA